MSSVLSACRRCASPFLRPCSAAGVVICESCQWIHITGVRETTAAVFPDGPVTRISGRDDLPSGVVLVTRYTPRRVCERLARVGVE